MISRLFRRKSAGVAETGSSTITPASQYQYGNANRFGRFSVSAEALASLEQDAALHSRAKPNEPSRGRRSSLGDVISIHQADKGAFVRGSASVLHVNWLAPDCLHVSLQASDAQAPHQRDGLGMVLQQNAPISLEWADGDENVRMASGVLECGISKHDGTLALRTSDGTLAFAETRAALWQGETWRHFIRAAPDALIGGFGARFQSQNLRGQQVEVYPDTSRGMVAPVPFLLLVSPRSTCGVYWQSSARMLVDACRSQPESVLVDLSEFQPDYFLMVSPSPLGVLARLSSLFPALALPPLWALGTHFGGDALETETRARDFVIDAREHGIPCAAVQLGSPLMEGGRPLTISAERFPNFGGLVEDLHDRGTQVVVETHPAIQQDETYPLYTSGMNRRVFVMYPDGSPVLAPAASGVGLFPDYMREDVRTWWSEQMRPLVRTGIDGVALYRANPDIKLQNHTVSLPDGVQHSVSGENVSHAAIRLRYSGRMADACRTAMQRDRSALRPFVRQSGGSVDISQFGTLTIETGSTWEGLQSAVRAALNGCVSGLQLVGLETAARDGELLARALQAGCLLPGLLCWLGRDEEAFPWSFGEEIAAACRDTLLLRRRLLPYLYASIALAREYGVPVVRPTWMVDPAGLGESLADESYLVGDHVLIAPVLKAGQRERSLYLPPGLWYDFLTHKTLEGGRKYSLRVPLNRVPLFVRAGAVLHLTSDETVQGNIIRVYPGVSDAVAYDDPGEGFSHLHGDYRWVYYTCHWETSQCFVMSRRRTGGYFPTDKRLRIEVVGLGETPEEVRLDRHGAPLWYYDQGILEVAADDDAARLEVWLSGSPTSPTRKRRAL